MSRHGRVVVGMGLLLLAAGSAFGQAGGESSVGYIDSAIPQTQLRIRGDAAYGDNRPERAEFLYPQDGLPKPESRVDYQEVSAYLEGAFLPNFSAFAEVPFRFLNPEINDNHAGLSDVNAGLKWAVLAADEQYLTLQFRTYAPSGLKHRGLGNGHVTLEPAVLYNRALTDDLHLEAELRDWVPVGGTDFEGNVVRYGVGASYDVYKDEGLRVAPVAEFVGWTVLSGKDDEENIGIVKNAAGETIVNAKLGVRTSSPFGEIYVGYGRALTGTVWYKDIIRLEYRLLF
ncbi:MAG TPA: hypothetical protein VJ739_18295 [Gemmataceae bacterium]|nr:hypothetical protein [Gemmataceae bacterium]